MVNLSTKSKVSISSHYEDMKGDTKIISTIGWSGVVRVIEGH